jgi:hypothetical protein|tara:strand:- start:863 stop:1252 length:390 start_codon:yes stop_codon:yes gene_type:complete
MNSTEHNGFAESWERSEPFLAAALGFSGSHSVEDVLEEVKEGSAVFYPVRDGAAVFKLGEYPQKRVLLIWLYGGEMASNIKGVLEAAEFHAEELECTELMIVGRRGWERVLKPHGFVHQGVVLTKGIGG